MITINDNDLPITVAQKIVAGTDYAEHDMFDLEEIREIADYLMVYYENHKEGD